MSTFTLAISFWTTSNLLWSWTWHSGFLCNIAVYSIGPCFYHQSHPQLGILFALAPSVHSFRVISPLISSSILGIYHPGEFIFQCPIFLPFHTIHGVQRQEYRSGLPFPSPVDHIFLELSIMTCPFWVALHSMAHSFIELEKAMVLVIISLISLIRFLWLWFSVCLPSD